MNKSALITKISEASGIDATDAVEDAIRDWAEDRLPETAEPETEQDWADIEGTALVYQEDYLAEAVEDHAGYCEDCATTKDVLRHITEG